jgi:hypothetical protein
MPRGRAIFRTYSVVSDRLDFSHPNGTLLRLVRENDGIWRLLIEVSESVTQEGLRKAVPLACQFRDTLAGLQGPEDPRLRFLLVLDRQQRTGRMGYKRLAVSVSRLIYAWAEESVEYERQGLAPQASLVSANALNHLDWCGFSSEDAHETLEQCVEELQRTRHPEIQDYPITQAKVREMLRSFRKSALGQAVRKGVSNDIRKEIKKYCAEQYARLWGSRRINPFLYDSPGARAHQAAGDCRLAEPEGGTNRTDPPHGAK